MWFVYMVRCADTSLYTGIASNVERRILEHNHSSRIGSKYVRARRPVALVYKEKATSRNAALRREAAIKKLSRRAKEQLINSHEY